MSAQTKGNSFCSYLVGEKINSDLEPDNMLLWSDIKNLHLEAR